VHVHQVASPFAFRECTSSAAALLLAASLSFSSVCFFGRNQGCHVYVRFGLGVRFCGTGCTNSRGV
jgi:hypothetical protein